MPDVPVFEAHLNSRGLVVVSGEIDVMSVAALRRSLMRALEETTGTLVLDLSGVRFMDASGVGALVDVNNKAAESGREVVVTRPSAVVRRMISILGPAWPIELR